MTQQFRVVHDDPAIVVVDKAAGVLTVPTPRRERNTLVDLVGRYVRRDVFVVHRLDRDTSGLLVFAKRRDVASKIVAAWSEHERIYDVLVHGAVARDDGVVDTRLTTTRNLDRRSTRGGERGERAVTRYRVVERVRGATYVECKLETGRRNQIRVHMRELGHPILGDDRYARDVAPHRAWRGGLALHARTLVVTHPVSGERLTFDAGLRPDFAAFLARTR